MQVWNVHAQAKPFTCDVQKKCFPKNLMFRNGLVSELFSHLDKENQAALTTVSTWKGHASQLICKRPKSVSARGPRESVSLSSARLFEQVIGLPKWFRWVIPSAKNQYVTEYFHIIVRLTLTLSTIAHCVSLVQRQTPRPIHRNKTPIILS